MKTLGYNKFSLLGWSDGGITSLILAAKYPENIRKLIVTGSNAYITPEEMEIYESNGVYIILNEKIKSNIHCIQFSILEIRNIDTWSDRMKSPLIALYGEEYFQCTWGSWIDAMRYIFDHQKGDICKNDLLKITCPTLIVHGEKDVMVLREHPDYLKANIKNSRYIV